MSSMASEAALKQAKAGLHLIPEHMRDGVISYLAHGRNVGGFLTCLLEADPEAWRRADQRNMAAQEGWLKFLLEHMPRNAWGAANKRIAWQKQKGLEGWES